METFNNQDVVIECGECGNELVVKVLEIVNCRKVQCPSCKIKIDLAAHNSIAGMGVPETYFPFQGLDEYIKQVEEKRKKNK